MRGQLARLHHLLLFADAGVEDAACAQFDAAPAGPASTRLSAGGACRQSDFYEIPAIHAIPVVITNAPNCCAA
jgi:hypothetical protein